MLHTYKIGTLNTAVYIKIHNSDPCQIVDKIKFFSKFNKFIII